MEFTGKKLLVFGGAGLVGQPICKMAAEEGVAEITICSLFEHETKDFAESLHHAFPKVKINREWGNIFVREEYKDKPLTELLGSEESRRGLITDILDPLNRDILSRATIFKVLHKHKPDIVIDSINTATGIAYQNLYGVSKEVMGTMDGDNSEDVKKAAVQKLLCTQYLPQLIRHVQIFLASMVEHKTKIYLKIGTCGTGGMGLNIPYTHSEDKPSQMLLSKAAVAGGQSLLMFLMARTPGGPIVKELKPAAAIAWKRVAVGPVKKKGKEVYLEDVGLSDATTLKGVFEKRPNTTPKFLTENSKPKALIAPYIDTGENGLFSLGEFESLTEEGQMEFITPDEIAQDAIWEIKGSNTGHDIVAALDNSTMGPTYRAGYMRNSAIEELHRAIKDSGIDSVAFEQLGPPRLSKLLYEAHLLKLCYGTFENVIKADSADIIKTLEQKLMSDNDLRSRIISIGVPILLPNGEQLLRGSYVAIPADIPGKPNVRFEITGDLVEKWAKDGWIDLRMSNIESWQTRLQKIIESVEAMPKSDNSSFEAKGRHYWQDENGNYPISIAKLSSYIFITEESGLRMKG